MRTAQFESQFHSRNDERIDTYMSWILSIQVADGCEKFACGLLRGAEDVVQGLDLEDAVCRAYHAAPPFCAMSSSYSSPSSWWSMSSISARMKSMVRACPM